MDLVALGSWVQVASGQHSWQHFITIYSPTATWIAYGKRVEHRSICFEIYSRWNRFSDGAFMSAYNDLYLLAMIQVLLDNQSSVISKISMALGSKSDNPVDLTRLACGHIQRPLPGVLQFVSQCIDETPSLEWRSYSSRLCRQLRLIEPWIAPGKVTLKTVFDAILRKEQKAQMESGPFSPSDPYVLCTALVHLSDTLPVTRSMEHAMTQLTADLNNASEPIVHFCTKSITSSPTLSHLFLYMLAKDLEYVPTDNRVLRLACECLCQYSYDGTSPIFAPTGPIPDTARSLYAIFLWAMIMARRPLLNMSGWLKWILQGQHDELVTKFELIYKDVCRAKLTRIDFAVAFQNGVEGAVDGLVHCLKKLVGGLECNIILQRIQL